MAEIYYRSIEDTALAIRNRSVSPIDLAEEILGRIAQLDPGLNSYLRVNPDDARKHAEEAHHEIEAGFYRGPLHGMPIAVKDVCYTRSAPTSHGMPSLRNWIPGEDATVVTRLERSGAVLLGKLNMTEAASLHHHPEMPRPRNPWNDRLWTGASSSGAGVATAAGLCFASIGSDTAGSIRVPSACNNLCGLRPTWGLVSRYGTHGSVAEYDTIGPMARNVKDLAVIMSVIAGEDANDPTSSANPVPVYQEELAARPSLKGLRIGVDRNFNYWELSSELVDIYEAAIEVVVREGAEVVDATLPTNFDQIFEASGAIILSAMARSQNHQFAVSRHTYSGPLAGAIEFGQGVPAAAVDDARETCRIFRENLIASLSNVDALMMPVLPSGTPTWEEFEEMAERDMPKLLRYTIAASVAGLPALNFPVGRTNDRRPVSAQLIGKPFGEVPLLWAGHRYQMATDWHHGHPLP